MTSGFDLKHFDEYTLVKRNLHKYNSIHTNKDVFVAKKIGPFKTNKHQDINLEADNIIINNDPNNDPKNTVGFVNETCIIKYNQFKFIWITINDIKRPFLKIEDTEIRIFNLHIHHKDLQNFV